MRILLLILLTTSCALPKPKHTPFTGFKSTQDRMIDCFKLLKSFGESGKRASEFCKEIYKEEN